MASTRTTSLVVASIVALAFGALTVLSGGRALFGSAEAQAAVGNAVPFVLWFNFLAGFAYILAGVGLFLRHPPAVWISIGIFACTALVALALAVHMMQGGAFEMRTVGAMILRTGVWAGISVVAWRHIRQATSI
ncbi:hypothetical protein [uncultured Aliiroseovarius sp.]|uniref:hypothetical protein n=1 Tax=uncultured Aliiroseovarius sp. TaxID=1658783 RepID=UPI002607B76A|nr:hypothetical protein [uncultured Aliiroseovarius sp.]